MEIDSNGVSQALSSIEVALNSIKKAINNVESAQGSLDNRISGKIGGFSDATSSLTSALNSTKSIINKCDEYISETKSAVLLLQNLSSELSGNMTNNDILSLGKGPLNKEFLEDPAGYMGKVQREKAKKELVKKGLIDKDINRVLNREISIEALFSEIISDNSENGRERYKRILESEYLQQSQYSASATQQQLDSLNTEKKGIEKRINEINAILGSHQGMYYKRQIPTDGISDVDLYKEKATLEERNKQINKEIVSITQKANGYGNTDFQFYSMDELDAAIKECNAQIASLIKKLNDANTKKYERQSFNTVMDKLWTGDTLDEAMASIVAYSYVDGNGCEIYDFDVMSAYGKGDSVKLLTYADLYGDSKATTKLTELLPKSEDPLSEGDEYYTKIYEIREFFGENSGDYFTGSIFDDSEVNSIKEQLSQAVHTREVYTTIKSNIDTNIDYYFENIDQYILREDFDKNSKFNGDFELLNNLNAIDELYDKYCNDAKLTQEQRDTIEKLRLQRAELEREYKKLHNSAEAVDVKAEKEELERQMADIDVQIKDQSIPNGYKEYTGIILSYIVNASTNIDDNNYVHDNYAVGLAYPDIALLGTTSSFKENAIDYCRKWRKVMSDTEIESFNYICNTEGYAKGYDYLLRILPTLDKRYVGEEQQKDAEWAHDNPFIASIGSIFKKPIEGIGGAIYSVGCLLNGTDIRMSNTYSPAYIWSGTVSEDIRILNGDTAAFFYNTSMSMSDTGLVIGLTALTGGTCSFLFATGIMGSSVYLSTLNEALERGIDDGRAVLLALGCAAVESIMEGYSVGHLIGLEKEFSEVLQNSTIMNKIITKLTDVGISSKTATNLLAMTYCALDQALVEGDEELWTEVADYVLDIAISGDLSKHEVSIKKYKQEHPGCSETEAYAHELGNLMNDVRMAWLGGVASGIFFGVGKGSSTVRHNNAMYSMYNQYLNQQLQTIQGAMAKRFNIPVNVNMNLNSDNSDVDIDSQSLTNSVGSSVSSVLKTPDEILETFMKEGMDKYSHYDLKSTLDESDRFSYIEGQAERLKQYLGLAVTKEQQNVLSEILLNGGYEGFSFDSNLCTHDNRITELARRLSMATLYLTNPETFMFLAENGVNMFHGTNSAILSSVLTDGLNSVDRIEQGGNTVLTGEFGTMQSGGLDMHNSIRGSNFISFTDVFELAYGYARSKDDGSFQVVIGTTTEDIDSSSKVSIGSDLTEIGVKDNLPVDKIKTILVPGDKVEYVKKMVGDKDIKVLSMDGYDQKAFYYYDSFFPMPEGKFDEFAEYVGECNAVAKDMQKTDVSSDNLETKTSSIIDENIQVIDVSTIDTEGHQNPREKGADPNVMNMSYASYDIVYKTTGDVDSAIDKIVADNKTGKVLLELDNTIGLTEENISKLPENVEIRVLGDYGLENFAGFKSNLSALHTLENATYSVKQMKQIMQVIGEFESGIDPNWDDTSKAKYAYDFINNRFTYTAKTGGNNSRDSHFDGLTNLVDNISTCQGFAHTYRELLTRMGITCYEISGKIIGGHSQHAFNVVVLNGETVIIDATRNRFNDDNYRELEDPDITADEREKLELKIKNNNEKFSDSGFIVDKVYQYVFKSNKDLKNDVTITDFKKRMGDAISDISLNEDGTFTIKTKYGLTLNTTRNALHSQNIVDEILSLHESHESLLVDEANSFDDSIRVIDVSKIDTEKHDTSSDNLETKTSSIIDESEQVIDVPEFDMSKNKRWENYDKTKFDKTFKSVELDGVTYYIADGEDFKFLVHSIDATSNTIKSNGSSLDIEQQMLKLRNELPSHPELFINSDFDNTLLSCSTISEKGMATYGKPLKASGNDILIGFNEDNINKVYAYSTSDYGTLRDAKPSSSNDSVLGLASEKRIGGYTYDEVVISREGRKPDYVISPYAPGDKRNDNNILWAKAYGIPIVYINRQAYTEKYDAAIEDIIKITENGLCLDEASYQNALDLQSSIKAIYNTDINSKYYNTNFYKLQKDTLLNNPTVENANRLGNSLHSIFADECVHSDVSSVVFDVIINKFDLEKKYSYLTRDEIASLLIKSFNVPRDTNYTDFKFELMQLDKYAVFMKVLHEYDQKLDNGTCLNHDEYSKYVEELNNVGDEKTSADKYIKEFLLKQYEAFKVNPNKENADIIFNMGYLADYEIHEQYVNSAKYNNVDDIVFDIIISHFDLASKYPNLSKEMIIKGLIEILNIPRPGGNYSWDFDFELKQLDTYANEIVAKLGNLLDPLAPSHSNITLNDVIEKIRDSNYNSLSYYKGRITELWVTQLESLIGKFKIQENTKQAIMSKLLEQIDNIKDGTINDIIMGTGMSVYAPDVENALRKECLSFFNYLNSVVETKGIKWLEDGINYAFSLYAFECSLNDAPVG